MGTTIRHDPARGVFFAMMGDEEAVLTYELLEGVMDMTYVFVPPAFRGRGMGARLTKAAFEYAKAEKLRVIPTCPFIRSDFLDRFPEYRELLARE